MIRCVARVSFPFPQFLIRLPYIDILSARNRCRHCRSAGACFEWPHLDLRVRRRSDFYLCSYPEHSKCVCNHQSVHDAQMEITSGICRAPLFAMLPSGWSSIIVVSGFDTKLHPCFTFTSLLFGLWETEMYLYPCTSDTITVRKGYMTVLDLSACAGRRR